MSVFQVTGDGRWLADPNRPSRDVRLIGDPGAGLDADAAAAIREAAREILTDGPEPAIPSPGPELFGRMMSWCLGEDVPPEYVPMLSADLGFADAGVHWPGHADPAEIDVVVVGAGVSGLCLAGELDRLGVPWTMFERHRDLGGTWLENHYPGVGVDTPNHFYSYSFAPNPGWRHYFSPGDEIAEYLARFADDRGLRRNIGFGHEVLGARWDADAQRWEIDVVGPDGPFSVAARVLVSATGHFNQPVEVAFEGRGSFAGRQFHTARWPDDLDLGGQRVAVIGTGASAMQLVPTIAPQVERLDLFQRTPQWARPVPEYDRPVDPAAALLFSEMPFYAEWYRFAQFWRYGDGLLRFLRKDPGWAHPERSLNRTNDRHREEMVAFIRSELAGRPDLAERCIPDYPPFAKRILIDNGWYRALLRPNVRLVTERIDRFEPQGIRTVDGALAEVDVVVHATGFSITSLANRMDIRGADRTLAEDWADENPTAHLGITVPGFPNFFVMYGPNTNMGHGGSAMWLAETQTRYIAGCLSMLADRGCRSMDVTEDARRGHTEMVDRLHEDLVWTHPGVDTYYRNAHGKVRSPMPFRLVDYWHMTRDPDPADFVLRR